MATIITKNSQTASAVPAASSLEVGELAVNTADGKLYTEHTGGVVKEIIPSTVVDGGITANKLASNAVTTAKIADANVTGVKLENSGVTAGSYGSSSAIPVVTVDAKGRLTSVSTTSVSASAPTTAQVLSATAGLTAGEVGSYMVGNVNTTSGTQSFGGTRAGSQIVPSAITFYVDGTGQWINQGSALSGTWRCLGYNNSQAYGANVHGTLWLRIS
jgi:hypothetical protein